MLVIRVIIVIGVFCTSRRDSSQEVHPCVSVFSVMEVVHYMQALYNEITPKNVRKLLFAVNFVFHPYNTLLDCFFFFLKHEYCSHNNIILSTSCFEHTCRESGAFYTYCELQLNYWWLSFFVFWTRRKLMQCMIHRRNVCVLENSKARKHVWMCTAYAQLQTF